MSVSSVVEHCIAHTTSQSDLGAYAALIAERQRALDLETIHAQLCDTTKYPALADYHDLVRSLSAPRDLSTIHVAFAAKHKSFDFSVAFSTANLDVYIHVALPPPCDARDWHMHLKSNRFMTSDQDVSTVPKRVLRFVYALFDAKVRFGVVDGRLRLK